MGMMQFFPSHQDCHGHCSYIKPKILFDLGAISFMTATTSVYFLLFTLQELSNLCGYAL